MNKLTRALTMGGFGVLAALAVGTGPAQAAGSTVATPESKTAVAGKQGAGQGTRWIDGSQTVGYYRSLRACELAGHFGERRGAWDDHDCDFVRVGLRRGAWALEVADDDNWGRQGLGRPFSVIRGFPSQFRPGWAGQFRPARPGFFRPGQHGPHRPAHWDRDRFDGRDNDGPRWGNDGRRDNDGPGRNGFPGRR